MRGVTRFFTPRCAFVHTAVLLCLHCGVNVVAVRWNFEV